MGGVQWWCAATTEPWTGRWQAYPGVWLFMLALAAMSWRVWRNVPDERRRPGRLVSLVAGLLLVWIALDWPVGPLGAGYLSSVHAVQFLLLAMFAPPLLLIGGAAGLEALLQRHPRARSAVSAATHPLIAMIVFVIVMVATHVPTVVDAFMASQLGAFAIDTLWLGSGLLFWYPAVARMPERSRFNPPLRMLYLFFGTQAHLFIAVWLLSAGFPVYGTYELSPPIAALDPVQDQQLAGALMIALGGPFVLAAITVIFFRWQGAGEEPGNEVLARG